MSLPIQTHRSSSSIHLDMLGDASSNVHMQYLREGVLMTEAEENKLHQTSFIKVKNIKKN